MILNSLALAYLGDAIYELYVRKYLLSIGIVKVKELQKEAVNYVSAKSQAKFLNNMIESNFLTDDEIDIVHSSADIPVSRTCSDADYVIYRNLESKYYNGTIEVPYQKALEFEQTHKVIFPQNTINKERYFYDLQIDYLETMILESPEKAYEKINKLINNK